ncbi:MAG: hypothetical protein NT076_03335 [Candidatus Pacearchaeota archaeon]|nr:hypothetical protein [Candidatus Pacearchaeota archaeon]
MKTRADLHFHGPWAWYKENPREGPRTMENYAKHLFTKRQVTAHTDFNGKESTEVVNGQQGFFHRFILPTVRDTADYVFEVLNGGFDVDVYRKSDNQKRRITLTQEIPTKQGHILAVGALEHIVPFRTAEETAKQILDSSGIVIADHPTVAGGLDEEIIIELANRSLLQAIEEDWALPYPLTKSYPAVRRLARRIGKPVVRDSDGHSWAELREAASSIYETSERKDPVREIIYAILTNHVKTPEIPITIREHTIRLARAVKHQYKTLGLPKKFLGKKIAGLIGCNTED